MAVFIGENKSELFERYHLSSGDGMNEDWLQEQLFQFPALLNHLPDCQHDPIIPICRELPIVGASSTVFLDIFAVRKSGRPVLVECKLWRNPQARREVIGQTLEYGALVHGMSYSDIQAILSRKLDTDEANPLFSIVAKQYADRLESSFHDTFQTCLTTGDFDLVIAGDGIRTDIVAVSELLNARNVGSAALHLLEVQIYRNGKGELFINPTTSLKTQVVRRHIIMNDNGQSIELMQDKSDEPPEISAQALSRKEADKVFWDRFRATIRFDHPDQDRPRYGGRNNVRLPLPDPATWMTCYRSRAEGGSVGLFFRLVEEKGMRLFETLKARQSELEAELGTSLSFSANDNKPTISISSPFDIDNEAEQEAQLEWLKTYANKMVSLFRPLLR